VIEIVLLDDHPIVINGIEALLALETDMRVVASCSDARAAIDAVKARKPDILLLDLQMPGLNGFDVLRQLHPMRLPTRSIVYVGVASERDITRAMKLGARGVVSKDLPTKFLVKAIRTVFGGDVWVEKNIAERTLHTLLSPDQNAALGALSERELEVIRLVGEGLPYTQIAARLGITEATVKVHLHHVYEKLELSGRHELIPWMYRNRLLPSL
jgi:two-component system nitrate/nitrite response regulator NarL